MPQPVTLRGPEFAFEAYTVNEAKKAGIIDAQGKPGTHIPVSCQFKQGDGAHLAKMLSGWQKQNPQTILIATARYTLTVYQPKRVSK